MRKCWSGHPGEAAAGEGRAAHGGSPARHRAREETSPAWGGDTRPRSAHPRGPRHKDGSGHRHGRCSGPDRRVSLQARQWAAGQALSLPQGPRDGPGPEQGCWSAPLGGGGGRGPGPGPELYEGACWAQGRLGAAKATLLLLLPALNRGGVCTADRLLERQTPPRKPGAVSPGHPKAEDKRVGERDEASGRGGPALTASPHPHGAVLTPRISACGYLTLYRGNQGETRRQGGP